MILAAVLMDHCDAVLMVYQSGCWSRAIIRLLNVVVSELNLLDLLQLFAFLDDNLFLLHVRGTITFAILSVTIHTRVVTAKVVPTLFRSF